MSHIVTFKPNSCIRSGGVKEVLDQVVRLHQFCHFGWKTLIGFTVFLNGYFYSTSVGGRLIRPNIRTGAEVSEQHPNANAVVLRKQQLDNDHAEVTQYGPQRRSADSTQAGRVAAAVKVTVGLIRPNVHHNPDHYGDSDDGVKLPAVSVST